MSDKWTTWAWAIGDPGHESENDDELREAIEGRIAKAEILAKLDAGRVVQLDARIAVLERVARIGRYMIRDAIRSIGADVPAATTVEGLAAIIRALPVEAS
jgi:hypothetical protein